MNALTIVMSLGGGLGLFLYGMKLMSDSIEKVAGAKLRSVLEVLTKNKFAGLIVGVIFTAIIQSSSATTVMVVSFVNAGLMNLFQAAGVIYGANIGTTVTSQLVSFNLSEYAPVFVLAGVIMFLFFKKPAVKKVGEVVVGFGILFVGLSMMSSSMEVLKSSAMVTDTLASLTNPLLAVLAGFIITSILQSSSVTVSIVLLMATQGLLVLPVCFYLILGCNIGSCTTALLASLSGKKDAKRAALIHFLFNVIGTAVLALILLVAIGPVENLILKISGNDIGRSVANAHTIFKVFQVIILMPFSNYLVRLTYFFVKGDDRKADRAELKYIGEQYILTPATAVPQVVKEINRMGKIATENLNLAMDALLTENEEEAQRVFEVEKTIDFLNHEITQYLVRANQLSLPVDDRKLLGGLFHVVSDIERVGDHAENIAEDAHAKKTLKLAFSEEGNKELREMVAMVDQILSLSLDMFRNNTKEHLEEILALETQIDVKERELQNSHIERLNNNKCTAQAGMMFSDLASNLERVGDHATNIAFSILDDDPESNKAPKDPYECGYNT
ncbi:MAG: Na/Pi cotransporter family protein [Clostridiales bacterium]|nr:Na/Pi cotransporter family protein [Clostridiales bacterium]